MSNKLIHGFPVSKKCNFFWWCLCLYVFIWDFSKFLIWAGIIFYENVITWSQVIHNKWNNTCFVLFWPLIWLEWHTSKNTWGNSAPSDKHLIDIDIVSFHFTMWLQRWSCFIFFLQDLNWKIQKGPHWSTDLLFVILHPAARKYVTYLHQAIDDCSTLRINFTNGYWFFYFGL